LIHQLNWIMSPISSSNLSFKLCTESITEYQQLSYSKIQNIFVVLNRNFKISRDTFCSWRKIQETRKHQRNVTNFSSHALDIMIAICNRLRTRVLLNSSDLASLTCQNQCWSSVVGYRIECCEVVCRVECVVWSNLLFIFVNSPLLNAVRLSVSTSLIFKTHLLNDTPANFNKRFVWFAWLTNNRTFQTCNQFNSNIFQNVHRQHCFWICWYLTTSFCFWKHNFGNYVTQTKSDVFICALAGFVVLRRIAL
jgi:hypothetical protein